MLNNKNVFPLINTIVASLVLVFAFIIIMHNPSRYSIEINIGFPIKKFAYNVNSNLTNTLNSIFNKPDYSNIILELQNSISNLQQQNAELRNLLLANNITERENTDLKKQLSFINQNSFKNIITSTITVNLTSSINANIIINTGSNNSIASGNLVVNNFGVIGYIETVYNDYSYVSTIFSKDFRIAAKTQTTNYNVVISGNNTKLLDIIAFTETYNFKEGELVYTSSIEKRYPAYIPIGYVTKINNKYQVVPFYNTNTTDIYAFILQ